MLLDAVDAEAIGADVAAADEGAAGGKPLSEKDGAKRRHVTLMDWGAAPVVEITVSAWQPDRHPGHGEDMPPTLPVDGCLAFGLGHLQGLSQCCIAVLDVG